MILMGIGDWGFGDWGLENGADPQSPIPSLQHPMSHTKKILKD